MANKVTFDYSKAAGFVQEHEMAYMNESEPFLFLDFYPAGNELSHYPLETLL